MSLSATHCTAAINSLFGTHDLPGPDSPLSQLHKLIEQVLPVHADHPSQAVMQRMVLAEILAHVTDKQADNAELALQKLHKNHFLPTEVPDSPTEAQAQLDALATAQHLLKSGAGKDTLQACFKHPVEQRLQEPMLHMIETSGQIVKEHPSLSGRPFADILHYAKSVVDTPHDTLACKVLRASIKTVESTQPATHALSPAEKTAVFSWRQGMHVEGKHSILNKVQHRLAKFRSYIARAAHHHALTHARFDPTAPLSSLKTVVKHSALTLADTAQRAAGVNKSPFLGLTRFGTGHSVLQPPHRDAELLDKHLNTAISALKTHLSQSLPTQTAEAILQSPDMAILHMAPALQALAKRTLPGKLVFKIANNKLINTLRRPSHPSARQTGQPVIPTSQLQLAVLAHWSDKSRNHHPQGVTLTSTDVRHIAARLQHAINSPELSHTATTLPTSLMKLIGTTLDYRLLKEWGEDNNISPQHENNSAQPSEFAKAMHEAQLILRPDTNKAESLQPDDIHKLLRHFALEHSPGSNLTLADGGLQGINTSTLALNLTLGKTNQFTISPVVADIRATRNRSAVFNMGTSLVVGGEIFLGRQTQMAGQVGGGAALTLKAGIPEWITSLHDLNLGGLQPFKWLPALDAKLNLGVSASSSLLGLEQTQATGVRLRFINQREANGSVQTTSVRPQMAALLDYMFSCCQGDKRQMTAPQLWQDFANHYFDTKNLSVSWQDYHTSAAKSNITITGSARAGFKLSQKFTARPGLTASVAANKTWFNHTNRKELSGQHPVMRNDRASSHDINLTLGANITSIPIHDLPGTLNGTQNALSGSVPLGSATFELLSGGFASTFRTVMANGHFPDIFTVRDMTHRNVHDLLSMLNEPAHRHEWEQAAISAIGKGREAGLARLDEYIQHVTDYARPNQTYTMRSRLQAEPLQQLSYLWASYQTAAQHGQINTMSSRMEEISTLLLRQENWIPHSMVTMHNNARQTNTGLNFGLQFASQTTVSGERKLEFLGTNIAALDKWAKTHREPLALTPPDETSTPITSDREK